MRAGRGRLGVAAGVAVVVVAAVAAAAGRGAGDPAVVVADQHGRQVASAPLPEDGRFALVYLHSVYRAQVTETFAVAGGGFRLVEVASPSEAVLDYYELDGRRQAGGGWLRLEPDATPRLEALPLVASELGRRTLVVGGRRLPLYASGQAPVRLVLSIRR